MSLEDLAINLSHLTTDGNGSETKAPKHQGHETSTITSSGEYH